MMSEAVGQTPDVSPPRPPPERPPIVFVRSENGGTLDCSPKSAKITEKPTAYYWGYDFLFYMELVARFFFAQRKICMALCARMTRTYCFFLKKKKSSMVPIMMTRQGFEVLGMTPVQG